MLDFEQQANQAQALASLNEDWHLLEDSSFPYCIDRTDRTENRDAPKADAKMRLDDELVIRRGRPTMISAKYRAREERRRFLKISAGKLRRIEDPEASLCRSVLINNAVRRLQRENRDEKSRNYALSVNYLHDSAKENNDNGNLIIGVTDDDATSRKRLNEEPRSEVVDAKRQRHDDLDLHDDLFSDCYILSPTTSRLDATSCYHHHEDRLCECNGSSRGIVVDTTDSSAFFSSVLDDPSQRTSACDVGMMDVGDVDTDRFCGDFSRFADSAKTLEERLAELQSLDDHFELTKFERNNNQSCGRAFHDIQTFHSLVPGLET